MCLITADTLVCSRLFVSERQDILLDTLMTSFINGIRDFIAKPIVIVVIRYRMLAPKGAPRNDEQAANKMILSSISKIHPDSWRVGLTKIFMRDDVVNLLDDARKSKYVLLTQIPFVNTNTD